MASDLCRRALTAVAAVWIGTGTLLITSAPAQAADAWWTPVALTGTAITQVSAIGGTIMVRTGKGEMLLSTNGGKTFATAPADATFPPISVVTAGSQRWEIDSAGRVLHAPSTAANSDSVIDPGSPDLGPGADLIAAPAALPGVVVAASTDGTVWRRGQDGDWKQALLLLPASLVQGVPRVTSITAFTGPLSEAIYLSTDGYAVLISTDGGDDWIRAGSGLPDSVNALVSDSTRHAVYAGTPDGLWVHVLQALLAPPAYQDAALVWRWLGIGAVTLVAAVLTLLGMMRLVPRRLTGSVP
jgi:hypothetical protein